MPLTIPQPIFLGKTHSGIRKNLKKIIESIDYKVERVVVPCAGAFTIEECVVAAGMKPNQIVSNDISVYSSVIGFLLDESREIGDLGFEVHDEYVKGLELPGGSEVEQAASVLFVIKLAQMKETNDFVKWQKREFIAQREKILSTYCVALDNLQKKLGGLTYTTRDCNDVMEEMKDMDGGTMIWYDPPYYKGGYTKMFDPRGMYSWNAPTVQEIDPGSCEEHIEKYSNCRALILPMLSDAANLTRIPKGFEVVYVEVLNVKDGRKAYVLCNKPLKSSGGKGIKVTDVPSRVYPVFNDEEITAKSEIKLVPVKREVSLYYYDLFVRGLGFSDAEAFYLFMIDGKVAGTVGFHVSHWTIKRLPTLHEDFGISVMSRKYKKLGKLMMMALTCREFVSSIEKAYKADGLRPTIRFIQTACLSKHQEASSHRGVFKKVKLKKLKEGGYNITYRTEVYERTYSQSLAKWLKQCSNDERGSSIDNDAPPQEEKVGVSPAGPLQQSA